MDKSSSHAPSLAYTEVAGQSLRRIESLSDGVFSIAMTLLVLNLRVPAAALVRTEADVGPALRELLPSVGGYVLGFLSLGIFWVCQSTQFTYLARSDRRLAWWHIALLLVVGLLPFSTAFLTTHFPLRGAVLVYWANLLLLGAALLGSYRYAQRHGLLLPEHAAVGRALVRRLGLMQVQYAAAAGLCFLSVPAGAGLLLLVQLNYALGLVADRWLGD
ncbi:MAG: TMEM175 family protein [Hymenobacter sp.]